jgi:hypothetical protein
MHLPSLLNQATASEDLFELMRNDTFQESLFLSHYLLHWPQVGDSLQFNRFIPLKVHGQWNSGYPSDLIQLWEDHRFLSTLKDHLHLSVNRDAPTFKFDSIYTEMLSKHPALLFVLGSLVLGVCWDTVLHLLRLSYSVLRPFLQLRKFLEECSFPEGDSPGDFLADPRRGGQLWNQRDIAEELVFRWIVYAKEFPIQGSRHLFV